MADWNMNIIEEFRSNGGHVASFANQPLLLLHHRGAKSGTERVNPLAYQKLDNGYAVFASKGGAPTNPDWYHNVLANPHVQAEVGTETLDLVAHEAKSEERHRIWEEQKRFNPGFAEYEDKTSRQIPVIVLEPETPN
ncbi:MAG TPA: nitroreductase family deazaflavin-dependent oxidoreductase [Actinomycetota bacterium]|jgi:deazaflavin-dependent oxidoreductase (nitroreductase family)